MTPDEHRAAAIDANNAAWEFLDGRPHTPDETDELLERVYAAAHHWRRAAGVTPINHARAAWLISRAHAALGNGDLALHHADRCATLTAGAGDDAADFDHAYAHEARARSLAALGRHDEARDERDRAAAAEIADDQDREIFDGDLVAEPWFGLSD